MAGCMHGRHVSPQSCQHCKRAFFQGDGTSNTQGAVVQVEHGDVCAVQCLSIHSDQHHVTTATELGTLQLWKLPSAYNHTAELVQDQLQPAAGPYHYIDHQGLVTGPVESIEHLRALFASNAISESTQVICQGESDWEPLEKRTVLLKALVTPSPPQPPPPPILP